MKPHIRSLGYTPGIYPPGPKNSILDVPGVQVGQKTIHDSDKGIHVGLTLIYPRGVKGTRLQASYAGIHTMNGGGEMTGTHFVRDWGYSCSPIAFTDSMSIGAVYQALMNHAWEVSRELGEDEETGYAHLGWPVVGETWGGHTTDIHDFKSTLTYEQVKEAIADAETRTTVDEGGYGGGAGMDCLGHKGGTGTASRIIPNSNSEEDDFVLGVLVQANYGGKRWLQIGGVPVGKLLIKEEQQKKQDGEENEGVADRSDKTGSSIIICILTTAPLLPHQLQRLAARARHGVTAVGGLIAGYHTSGDIFIALSTSDSCKPSVIRSDATKGPGGLPRVETERVETAVHDSINALFQACAEATEEAILNALCQAEDLVGYDGKVHKALDCEKVRVLLEKYLVSVDDIEGE